MERDSMETTPTTQTQLSTNTEEIKMKVSSTTPIVEQTVESSLLSYKEEELNAALSLSALSLPFIMRVSQIPLV